MSVCSVLWRSGLGSVQFMVMSLLHQLAPEHRYGEAASMARARLIPISRLHRILLSTHP
jgi:hypothetical protein